MRGRLWPRLSLLLTLATICGTVDPLPVLPPPREARSRPPRCNIPEAGLRPPPGGRGQPPGPVAVVGWGSDVDPQVVKLMERAVLEGGEGLAGDSEALRELHDGMLQARSRPLSSPPPRASE
jgi:hypothetical protein